jgi:3-oxoacyl-[acyl-carrier protein] reductase
MLGDLMDLRIRNRRAIIAGASAGLGYSSAMALAREGVTLFISARGEERLRNAVETIARETNASVTPVVADHGTREGRQALMKACPQPDILVITCSPPKATEDFREISEEDWYGSVTTTFVGPVELIKAAVDGMADRRWGRIVNIATGAAKHPTELRLLSGPTRSALVNYTVALSKRFAKDNVILNNLLPGLHATPGLEKMLSDRAERNGSSYAFEEQRLIEFFDMPTKRLADPDDFGAFCALLCSDYANSIVGQNLVIDGGTIHGMF